MTEKKKKNPVTLQCDCGACAMDSGPPVTTAVFVEVRDISAEGALDASAVEVTLTSLNKKRKLSPNSTKTGAHGELLATFNAVPQGRYRALAVRSVAGKPEASAARNVLIVKIKGPGEDEPQHVLLTMSKQGVAKFVFVNDRDESPLAGARVIIRGPDGSEERHTADAQGRIAIAGASGEVFSVVCLEHPGNSGISETEELGQ